MQFRQLLAATAALTLLAGCTQPNGAPNAGIMNGGGINKQDIGTLGGAVGGGLLGSQIGGGKGRLFATGLGVLAGGLIGNQIGKSLDDGDRAIAEQKTQKALETGQSGQALPWQGQNASGTVTPGPVSQNSNGQYCREYTQKINVGGQTKSGYGTACRQPDGSWQIVSQN